MSGGITTFKVALALCPVNAWPPMAVLTFTPKVVPVTFTMTEQVPGGKAFGVSVIDVGVVTTPPAQELDTTFATTNPAGRLSTNETAPKTAGGATLFVNVSVSALV